MKQSAFTIITDIKPGQADELGDLLDQIGDRIDENPYVRFGALEHLHYASFVIIGDEDAPQSLLFEGNVDGRPRAFLEQLLRQAGSAVDRIYRCCEEYPPAGADDVEAVLSYFEAHDAGTTAFYVGWPGRTVGEIHREQQLRDRIEDLLDAEEGPDLRRQSPEVIRRRLQDAVAGDDAWSWARRSPRPPFLVTHGKKVLGVLTAIPTGAFATLVRTAFGRSSGRPGRALARLALVATVGLGGYLVTRLRLEEASDGRKDLRRPDWRETYAVWSEQLGDIVQREDVQGQNHLASVTRIKEGWFRFTVLRVVLWGINLLARLTSNKGSLSGLSTIHFARWVIAPDRKHLIFLSNFDGSWESYLNDFIDLATKGLTAVWSNTDNEIGFPRTRWLLFGGARDEQRFKAYARYSQVRTRAWYSAYPELTMSNVGNNMRLREDLFAPLDPLATEAWFRRL